MNHTHAFLTVVREWAVRKSRAKKCTTESIHVHHDDDTAVDLELDRARQCHEHMFPVNRRQTPESAVLAATALQRAVRPACGAGLRILISISSKPSSAESISKFS